MEKLTYPIIFLLNAKRGNNYKERKVEIYKDIIKYIEPETNKVKLQAKLEDLVLKESNLDNPKEYKIRLTSKSKAFEEIKLRPKDYKNWKYAQEFYTTLNKVIKYQTSVNMLKNKTFFFETQKDTENNKSVVESKAVTMTSIIKVENDSKASFYSDAKDISNITNVTNITSITTNLNSKETKILNVDSELISSLKLVVDINWLSVGYTISTKNDISNETSKNLLLQAVNPFLNKFSKKSECK